MYSRGLIRYPVTWFHGQIVPSQIVLQNGLASVVQRLDSAIHRITLYPVDSAISFPNTYPLDNDLSGG